ncbi:MAG: DMT family transporter [Pseudomonadota bacterium]
MPHATTSVSTDPRAVAMLLMVVSSVCISFGGLVLRSMETSDAWQINFFRALALIAAISLIMIMRHRERTLAEVRKIGAPGLLGGACLALAGMAFLQAITNTTVANTLFTLSAIPFITAALAWLLLREPLGRATLATMVAAAIGVGVMMIEGVGVGSSYGNLMALVTAICFSGFAIIVRRNRQIDMLPTLIVSGVIILIVSGVWRWGRFDLSTQDILLCFLLGGVLSGFANALFVAASRHLAAAELTLFMLLEFALGPIWVWLFVNEIPTELTLVGGAIVIFAVALRAVLELRSSSRLKRGRPSPM